MKLMSDFKFIGVIALVFVLSLLVVIAAMAHDKNHPVDSDMHDWFMSLGSGRGACCADADGSVVMDSDWESRDGHFRVYINDKWMDVPDNALVKEPNLYGPTMVWMMYTSSEGMTIRCFMPGAAS